jgi:heterodisulfide reductase subunit C
VALCPQDINITDVMYSLKREAIRHRLYPSHFPIPVLAREFFNMVWRRGRNAEFWVVFRMAMRSNPLILLGMLRTGWEQLRTGRIALRREKIVRVEELRRALTSSREAH